MDVLSYPLPLLREKLQSPVTCAGGPAAARSPWGGRQLPQAVLSTATHPLEVCCFIPGSYFFLEKSVLLCQHLSSCFFGSLKRNFSFYIYHLNKYNNILVRDDTKASNYRGLKIEKNPCKDQIWVAFFFFFKLGIWFHGITLSIS